MAQFDVHRNSGRHAQSTPFVVVVQSSQFDGFQRRVVVPLVHAGGVGKVPFPSFNPIFRVEGIKVMLNPLEIVSVPVAALGPVVDSLADQGQAIISALDELFSRAWK
jgi:toxin CcdB